MAGQSGGSGAASIARVGYGHQMPDGNGVRPGSGTAGQHCPVLRSGDVAAANLRAFWAAEFSENFRIERIADLRSAVYSNLIRCDQAVLTRAGAASRAVAPRAGSFGHEEEDPDGKSFCRLEPE